MGVMYMHIDGVYGCYVHVYRLWIWLLYAVTFPWIFEYGNSVILELGKMGAKSITVYLIELLLVTVDWTE
jgi:hypothetical protein